MANLQRFTDILESLFDQVISEGKYCVHVHTYMYVQCHVSAAFMIECILIKFLHWRTNYPTRSLGWLEICFGIAFDRKPFCR